jgi:regulator of sigma E protease
LNLLPIPVLDGGHLAYYAIEAMRGKALNERAKQFGIDIGLFLLGALMIVATYNACFT